MPEIIEYTIEEMQLFEQIMKSEYAFRDVGLCTDAEKSELPILKSLISKLARTIALGRKNGFVKTPKKPSP